MFRKTFPAGPWNKFTVSILIGLSVFSQTLNRNLVNSRPRPSFIWSIPNLTWSAREKIHLIEKKLISEGSKAHLKPKHILFPSPKGNVLNACRSAFASFEKRLGSKCIGFGKRSGSLENAKAGMITAVSFGRIDPFGKR